MTQQVKFQIIVLEHGLANIFCKTHVVHILAFVGIMVSDVYTLLL